MSVLKRRRNFRLQVLEQELTETETKKEACVGGGFNTELLQSRERTDGLRENREAVRAQIKLLEIDQYLMKYEETAFLPRRNNELELLSSLVSCRQFSDRSSLNLILAYRIWKQFEQIHQLVLQIQLLSSYLRIYFNQSINLYETHLLPIVADTSIKLGLSFLSSRG
ncbi:hypothetical protein Bca52824_038416 [Brassica carinata]|uniref:Uncharacterized protein n=1 Tax=Brassica carinata TaxID=52824 RepID=A0A8X7RPI2_BRACI|nr:hypothetical protein Bca52824_038416 [Brassica carinata]